MKDEIENIIRDLEYVAFNLCNKKLEDLPECLTESTDPDDTLLLSIVKLKQLIKIETKPFTNDFANMLLVNALRQLTPEQRHKLTVDLIERDDYIENFTTGRSTCYSD